MVQQNKASTDVSNGANKRDKSSMSFPRKDARTMSGKADGKSQNGTAAGFRTDTAISSGRGGSERVLQKWMPDSGDTFDGGLESSAGGERWDQFAANEKKFGIKTDYDENYYTTRIDKSHPQYNQRMAAAEKKAREIEGSAAGTAHVLEERKMDYADGEDGGENEEDKYSGVRRQQDFPPLPGVNRENKYTPPARRAPTGNTTVKGAPVDPAIISSQLKMAKGQAAGKAEDPKNRATPPAATATPNATGSSTTPAHTAKAPESKVDAKPDAPQQKPTELKSVNQASTPLRPSGANSRTISPQAKEGQGTAPSATSTVERDVLKEFKTFANQQRANAEKVRSSKAKADKEVKLTELKKFADSFKLPTPVPVDLISIIAKDPAKQREIQEKAQRDAAEVARRKAEEAAAKEKKPLATKEGQQPAPIPQAVPVDRSRPAGAPPNTQPAGTGARHPGGRQSFAPQQYQYQNSRGGMHSIGQSGRLASRIRNAEAQKMEQNMRQPPTGPANAGDPSFGRRMGGIPNHMGAKLNPNSHEFRPNPFASSFSPNGHPSGGSSPRSAVNNAAEAQVGPTSGSASLVVIPKKKKGVNPKKCMIMAHIKSIPVPQGKNWDDNDGIKPSFDTPPTWRQAQDDEKPDSTMRLSYAEYFERQPFASQPTPNPTYVAPQLAHQHQLPFHLQANAAPRHSPHIAPVQMHPGHGAVQHPFNAEEHTRMMHSNSSQSFSSPRMGQIPIAYPPNMNSPAQMSYGPFVPGTPQMGQQFNRNFSNNPQYMPQGQMPMGAPMMMNPQFMQAQGMPAPHMQMYPPSGHQFMPPGATAPPPMPGANGYPSPGRAAAPIMVHQGSQQGQAMYMSLGMQYQQPVFTQQPGHINNMRGYSNPGPQQFGTSPQQMHQYGPQQQQHRNGSNNFKNYQGHNQHQGPQGGHPIPTGPQGRTQDGSDEAK